MATIEDLAYFSFFERKKKTYEECTCAFKLFKKICFLKAASIWLSILGPILAQMPKHIGEAKAFTCTCYASNQYPTNIYLVLRKRFQLTCVFLPPMKLLKCTVINKALFILTLLMLLKPLTM